MHVRRSAFLQGRSCSGASLASLSTGMNRGVDEGFIGLVLNSTFGLQASMSQCRKTRPTQSSRSSRNSRSSRLCLGGARSKSLCPWLGSCVGCQALFHVQAHLCRPCGEQFMPPRMARQPENTGPRQSSSNEGWNTQCMAWGSPGKLQLVQDAVCLCGQRRDTAVVHRGRCFSFWCGSHSLLVRVCSSLVLGIGAREVGLGEIPRIGERLCFPIRMRVGGSFFSVCVL